MKKYLLLRNNRESGTYSIEQLASIGLLPLDLIWIEGESTSWKYPEEIEALKALINYNASTKENQLTGNKEVFISLPSNFDQNKHLEITDEYSLHGNKKEPVSGASGIKPLKELKENYRASKERKPVWNKKVFQTSNASGVAAIFISVVLGAFVIKKLVDGYVPDATGETATATPVIDREAEKQADPNIRNALVKEIVPVYKSTATKTLRHADIKKQLKLSANNYKVGLFGGINGLQLTVVNTSPQMIDKAIVGIDYLKPNGSVVQSENILFVSIRPKDVQTISIPESNRGVKVRCKILKVSVHSYKEDLKVI